MLTHDKIKIETGADSSRTRQNPFIVREASRQRLTYLETMRGVAALVVVFSHCLAAFDVRAIIPVEPNDRWFGMPWYVFLNGAAAVNFFFVLSGYVLTLKPLQSRSFDAIAFGAVKRWPRLAGPVVVTVLLSWALWQIHAYWHVEAAKITGSTWLALFGYGFPPPPFLPDMSLKTALREGLWETFLYGSYQFDSSLWTMTTEFYGSFLAFALAAALIAVRHPILQFILLLLSLPILDHLSPFFVAFWCGIFLAWLHSMIVVELPRAIAIPIAATTIYGLGYVASVDAYAWIPSVNDVYVHSVSSALLIFVASSWEPFRKALDGAIGRRLGRYSFPIYLVHLLMILSLGMATFVLLDGLVGRVAAITASVAVSLASTAAVAHVLAAFDSRWVALVNLSTGRLFGLLHFRASDN